jgi:hypothetical protein
LTESREQLATKGGEIIVKFVKIVATVAFAAVALSLGACASKSQPAPPPASIGTSK